MEIEFNKKLIVPSNTEVVKNRDFGRIKGHLTRHQRVAFASFVKNAYLQMLENNNNEQRYFEVPLKQFREELGINHRNIFADDTEDYSLEKQLEILQTKVLEWRYKDESGKTLRVKKSVMLSDFEIDKEKSIVKFSLGNFLQDKVVCYGNAYISEMPIIASFKRSYSVALHDCLEQRKKFGKWKVEVKEFRELMGIIEDEYNQIFDLKKRVINPAIDEIEKNTEYFNLKYKSIKNGRSISHFEFTWGIESNPKKQKEKSKEDIIEEMKNYIYLVNGSVECKLIDLSITDEASEYMATLENKDEQRAKIKTKADFNEAIEYLKTIKK